MLLKYNVLAGIGAVIGFLNSILIWRQLGAGMESDTWFLAFSICASLSALVLVGVEQFLVFYSDRLVVSDESACGFFSVSIVWSIFTGVFFACGAALAAPLLVGIFAPGFSIYQKNETAYLLFWLLSQVAISPMLHVVKNLLSAHGKYGRSYCLSLVFPCAQLFTLMAMSLLGAGGTHELAKVVFVSSVLQFLMCLFFAKSRWKWPSKIDVPYFVDFVKNSTSVRIGHSLHNFLVVVIMNGVLSIQGMGAISVFQYAKRFADGAAAITIGPQGGIYHARQARSWAEVLWKDYVNNVIIYFKHSIPLFVFVGAGVWVVMPYVFSMVAKSSSVFPVEALSVVYLVLLIWQFIISIETVFVGVILTDRRSWVLWLVNGLFIGMFYWGTRHIVATSEVWAVAAIACLAQLGSLLIYLFFAAVFTRRHFGLNHA